MDSPVWIGAGYPVLAGAIAILWKAYQKKVKEVTKYQEDLIKEKEWHVRELEEFKKMVERRARHGRLEDSP